ncbi:MAG: lmo0937 family membrane protein [Phycisphaerales bacterium]|nr:lmo0937 family membrane protein [Phycisphaerales bacterium]
MLWTLALILVLLWLVGLITSYTLSGFIHVLLVVALIVVVIRLIQGRQVSI